MLISIVIILIYLSFIVEFLLWPVHSEASTGHLLRNWRSNKMKFNLIYLLIFILNSLFTITPLLISLLSLYHKDLFQINPFTYLGLILGWFGRLISVSSAYRLHKSELKFLVTDSIFKWSRNPVSLGLFITFFGLILILPYYLMIAGYVVFVLSINYKIGIEEKFLLEKYGTVYHHYARSTPKYLIV